MTKVLIIEDEAEILSFLQLELSHEGYEVDTTCDGRTGLEKIESGNYDIHWVTPRLLTQITIFIGTYKRILPHSLVSIRAIVLLCFISKLSLDL